MNDIRTLASAAMSNIDLPQISRAKILRPENRPPLTAIEIGQCALGPPVAFRRARTTKRTSSWGISVDLSQWNRHETGAGFFSQSGNEASCHSKIALMLGGSWRRRLKGTGIKSR
ncbi:MAG: hypothetical protein WB624_18135 [Xanthobacteraceae bacterium]|jgi:hypothetical protein